VANALVPQRRHREQQWHRIDAAFNGVPAVVQQGPFAGMALGPLTTGSHYPKLLGTYEKELHSVINKLVENGYSTIVDIGCGEGYYAIGLALTLRDALVFGFDINEEARRSCAKAAVANGVAARVTLGGECSHQELNLLCEPSRKAFVLIDCEGCEVRILDPEVVPNLRTTDFLVETHDFLVEGVSEILTTRFSSTHDIEFIPVAHRSAEDAKLPVELTDADRQRVLDESRQSDQTWMSCLARRADVSLKEFGARPVWPARFGGGGDGT
jgi:hypothetical protein